MEFEPGLPGQHFQRNFLLYFWQNCGLTFSNSSRLILTPDFYSPGYRGRGEISLIFLLFIAHSLLSLKNWPFYMVKLTLLTKWSSNYNFEMQNFCTNTSQNWKILPRLFKIDIKVSQIDANSILLMTPL